MPKSKTTQSPLNLVGIKVKNLRRSPTVITALEYADFEEVFEKQCQLVPMPRARYRCTRPKDHLGRHIQYGPNLDSKPTPRAFYDNVRGHWRAFA